jgi:predicted PurR-regulated permease PerM
MHKIEDQAFVWLLIATSFAFCLILWPYYGAVLWGVVGAIVFSPLHRRLMRTVGQRSGLAAILSVLIVVLIVIVPLMFIASSLLIEATGLYETLQSGKVDVGQYLGAAGEALPGWLKTLLARFGLDDSAGIQARLSGLFSEFLQLVVSQAVTVSQSTFELIVSLGVMLYLLFFLLRDGSDLVRRIENAVPLRASQRDALLENFATVVRATVKGSVVVAALQGALGGLMFWLLGIHAPVLWAVVMAFLALLPAVGAGIVWLPVALYLLASDSAWKGLLLIAYGMLVIGLVDNLLRPILVGKSTRIPDYVVLISTLGGISLFGLSGFVIGPVIAAMFISVWDNFAVSRAAWDEPAATDPDRPRKVEAKVPRPSPR